MAFAPASAGFSGQALRLVDVRRQKAEANVHETGCSMRPLSIVAQYLELGTGHIGEHLQALVERRQSRRRKARLTVQANECIVRLPLECYGGAYATLWEQRLASKTRVDTRISNAHCDTDHVLNLVQAPETIDLNDGETCAILSDAKEEFLSDRRSAVDRSVVDEVIAAFLEVDENELLDNFHNAEGIDTATDRSCTRSKWVDLCH